MRESIPSLLSLLHCREPDMRLRYASKKMMLSFGVFSRIAFAEQLCCKLEGFFQELGGFFQRSGRPSSADVEGSEFHSGQYLRS